MANGTRDRIANIGAGMVPTYHATKSVEEARAVVEQCRTATEELRRRLDERGVEWETDRSGFRVMWGNPVDEFHDTMQFKAVDNALPNGGLNVHICGFTPEQAIAATLGTGTCHLEEVDKDCDSASEYMIKREWCFDAVYRCSCGYRFGHVAHDHPNFCPNCGCRVMEVE